MTRPHARTRLICPITSPDVATARAAMAQAAARGAEAVELRLDYFAHVPDEGQVRALLAPPRPEAIVTCRPKREGGRFAGREDQRLALLRQAAALGADWLDIELSTLDGSTPAEQDRLAGLPPERTILSHHDLGACPAGLEGIIQRLESSPAAVVKVAFAAGGPEDALTALDVVRSCRKPAIALAMGEAGVLSRVLAAKLGAFGTFASLAPGAESAPGQPTLAEMLDLYRWRSIGPDTAVFGVIGCPVAHSMSPAIHNAAFAQAGIDAVYVPLLIQPGADNLGRFMDALLARPLLRWRGLSVTIPHKENALAYVGGANCDELARRIGAVNTISIQPGGALRGDNTDYAAVLEALCSAMGVGRDGLSGRRVAVLGAGGVARAVVAALAHCRAGVTIHNRTVARAIRLADEFGGSAAGLDAIQHGGTFRAEIIINCTPIGMHPHVDAAPMEAIPPCVKVVFDTIYNPIETRLLRLARQAGCTCISGVEMFINQAAAQFEIWTARPAPRQVMRDVVLHCLSRPT